MAVLLVAATEIELCEHDGLACGVGPVEAAAATARALALEPPSAVVHVGIAGGRGITPGGLVIGSESVYCDIAAEIPVIDRVEPDAGAPGRAARRPPRRARAPDRDERVRGRDATPTCGSRRWRASACFGRARWRACPRSRSARSRTRSPRATAARWRIGRALEALADATPARARSGRSVASPPMARRQKRVERPLPPPLPPAERTVGQLVGEAIRLYGANFWKALALGVPVVAVNALAWRRLVGSGRLGLVLVAAVLISLELRGRLGPGHGRPASLAVAAVAYAIARHRVPPFPVLVTIFVLPGLAWLALLGLAVPAAIVERLDLRAALVRGYRLAVERTSSTCSAGSPRSPSSSSSRSSACTSCSASSRRTRGSPRRHLPRSSCSPLVFLGSAILYVDQKARLDSRGDRRKE